MKSGIYKIICLTTNKIYIGSAVSISNRWYRHKWDLNNNVHGNTYLQKAWNKYQSCNFKFEVIELCQKEKLIEREQFYIDNLKPEYNLLQVAGSRLGCKLSEKTILKLKSKIYTEEEKAYMSACQIGKRHSEETKVKISLSSKGRRKSKQHRENISLSKKLRNFDIVSGFIP
jgi:group I intron endonuclease